MNKALVAKEMDNVAVALGRIEAGEKVSLISPSGKTLKGIIAGEEVPFAHKISTIAIGREGKVIRFGEVIGLAKEDIDEGRHVHVHNIRSARLI